MENENIIDICEEEIMEPEFEVLEGEIVETKEGNTALAMLIGAGLMAATTAAVKLGKKLWAKHKAKKELRQPDDDEPVEVTDEQIEEVATK